MAFFRLVLRRSQHSLLFPKRCPRLFSSNPLNQKKHFSHKINDPNVIFTANIDSYGGRIINHDEIISCPSIDMFEKKLYYTMTIWRKEGGIRGVWLEIPVDYSEFLPSALRTGFEIHHAHKESITLTYWFPGEKGVPNSLPLHNTHTIGVGAAIMNEQGELLLVQERTGPASKYKDFWKFPTGIVHAGEDCYKACEREVLEETGVHVTAENMISVREAHFKPREINQNQAGEKEKGSSTSSSSSTSIVSNIYQTNIFFVFACKPILNNDNHVDIIMQDHEISNCRWICANQFLESQGKIMPPGSVYNEINRKAVTAAQQMWEKEKETSDVDGPTASSSSISRSLIGFSHNEFPFRKGSNRLYFPKE